MRHAVRRRLSGVLLAASLTGCQAFPPAGTDQEANREFLSALAGLYETLGTDEARQYDWPDSWWYAGRAVRATAGLPVEPEDPAERSLSGPALEQLQAARTDLLSVLNSGGRILAPDPAARAQAAFDCWVEQQEEGWQTADIDLCRSGFERAMGEARAAVRSELVVLLPGEDGAGAVVVQTRGGRQALDRPYAASISSSPDAVPAERGDLSPTAVSGLFGDALGAVPPAPASFILQFEAGGQDLTETSKQVLLDLTADIRRRRNTDVTVIGHTDRAGAASSNERLARSRAEAVARLIEAEGVPVGAIDVKSFGETDLLVRTPDGVAEPRNRRVEVMVR
jgi:OmpA-OmpF porin, OOP family